MMKNLIVKYLEGKITPEEESALYDQLRDSEDNRLIFRAVEEEWAASHEPSQEAVRIQELLSRRHRARRIRRIVFGAAAAVAAAIGAVFFVNRTFIAPAGNNEPLYYTMEAPMGTHSRLSLPDGTDVWLNAGSTLRYSSEFGIGDRNISLEGEAYFEVARNDGLPFRVSAGECVFSVLGTKFDIQAYGEDGNVTAVLMQGSLKCEARDRTAYMSPGDRVIVNKDSEMLKDKVNAEQYRSWIDGLICYDKIELPALLRKLSREYNVEINLLTDAFDARTLHVSFSSDVPVETILKAISETVPIKVTSSGRTFTVDTK